MLQEYVAVIETLTLIPSSGGVFEVTIGNDLVFSKKALGRHPEPGEIASLLAAKTSPDSP